jgi:hypothetical protein
MFFSLSAASIDPRKQMSSGTCGWLVERTGRRHETVWEDRAYWVCRGGHGGAGGFHLSYGYFVFQPMEAPFIKPVSVT